MTEQPGVTEQPSVTGMLGSAVRMAWAAAARLLLARLALAAVIGALPALVAWQLKTLLDRVSTSEGALAFPVLALIVGTAALALLPEAARYLDAELQRRVGLAARRELFTSVGAIQGLRRFEDPGFHDRLSIAADSGTSGPPAVVSGALGVAQGILTVLAFVASLASLNGWMVLVVLVAALPALRAELLIGRWRARMTWDLGHAARREFFYANLMTGVTAAKEIRLYGLSQLFGARMLAELRTMNTAHRRMDSRELAMQAAQGILGAAVAGAGLWWAVRQASAGRLTVGDVALFVAAVAGVQGGLIAIVANLGQTHAAMLLFGHFRHVVQAPPDLPRGLGLDVPELRVGIELRDVWFRYGDDLPWVLRGVSLTIPAGAAVALVGENGAGKSTLVKLLCRFYDPARGRILWDGIDLRDLDVTGLRRRIGAVFQDFMAYELTAADNIGLGDVGLGDVGGLSDRARIVEAAQRAGCHDFLQALPRGYDTMLTRVYMNPEDRDDPSTGVVLSGGQWQRLAFARALLRRDADLLILDEPQSGQDAQSEHETGLRLREHRAGKTSVLISHRLSAVRDADVMVVLAAGEVTETGDHASLLAAGGSYSRLFQLQAAGYQVVAEQAGAQGS